MSRSAKEQLEALRALDEKLATLVGERARMVKAVVEAKGDLPVAALGLPKAADFELLLSQSAQEVPEPVRRELANEFSSMTQHVIGRGQVAVVGPKGGIAQEAAEHALGRGFDLRFFASIGDAVRSVEQGETGWAFVPFSSASEGTLLSTLRGLVNSKLSAVAEHYRPQVHDLYSVTGNLNDVERVFWTREAQLRCGARLAAELPKASTIEVKDAQFALSMVKEDHAAAVLSPRVQSVATSLHLMTRALDDDQEETIRYLVLSREPVQRTGQDRTIVLVALAEKPGSLMDALAPFAEREINLTRVESRPLRGSPWNDIFFIEFDGHITDRPVGAAFERIREHSRFAKLVGSFPRAQSFA